MACVKEGEVCLVSLYQLSRAVAHAQRRCGIAGNAPQGLRGRQSVRGDGKSRRAEKIQARAVRSRLAGHGQARPADRIDWMSGMELSLSRRATSGTNTIVVPTEARVWISMSSEQQRNVAALE